MKYIILGLILLSSGIAQEQSRYSCPEVDVDFEGNDIDTVSNVQSWQDCGNTNIFSQVI